MLVVIVAAVVMAVIAKSTSTHCVINNTYEFVLYPLVPRANERTENTTGDDRHMEQEMWL